MSISSFCEVYLIRHGQTKWNIEGKLQGHTDEPLNEEGEKQALDLKKKLSHVDFSAVFSSDLSRAYSTASIVIGDKKMDIVATSALRERYMGIWEGCFTHDLKEWLKIKGVSTESFLKDEYLSYKWQSEVESYVDVYERLNSFIKSKAVSHLGSTILLSSHGGVLRALLYKLDFRPELRWQVSNCAFIKLKVNKDGEISILECDGAKPVQDASISF